MKKSLLSILAVCFSLITVNAQTKALMGTTFFGGNGNGTIFTIPTGGNTLTNIYNFTAAATGYIPESGVVQAPNGKFYGVFNNGGANGYGGIYEVTEGGTYTLMYSFMGSTDGGNPKAALCLASNGLLYGSTYSFGAGNGTLFSYMPGSGTIVTLHTFTNTDGSSPNTAMIQASDGKLYGTVAGGGSYSNGVLFCYDFVAPSFNVLHHFNGATDGELPTELFEASNGTFYGLCGTTGPLGNGTIFSYEPIGQVFTTEYAFIATEGVGANCGFKEGAPGYLYALSSSGGANGFGSIFEYYFPTNMYTNLVNFTNAADGGSPMGGLVKSTMNNKFYGITYSGGSFNNGIAFEFDPVGPTFTTLADFTGANGQNPKYVTLCEYIPLQSTISAVDVLCAGNCNGSATVAPSGGMPPYSYSWAPVVSTQQTNAGLCQNTYTCTITDFNGSVITQTVDVNAPTGIIGANSGTDVTCAGASDGTATTNPTGGMPPYTFLWSPGGQTTQTAIGLGGGAYSVDIIDANGCLVTDYHTVIEPSALIVSVSQTQVGCEGAMKNAAHANVAGGTSPYSYSWNTGDNTQDIFDQDAIYVEVTVTDANACPSAGGFITLTENPSTDLTGMVLAPTLNIDNGFVYAFKSQPSINGVDTVAIVPIVSGAPNYYTFSSLPANLYYIKVVPDAATYQSAVPTYFGDQFQWDSAVPVFHGCSVVDNADINVIELNSGPTGDGFVSGYIIEGNGFGNLRVLNDGSHPNLPCVPGGPLKGIDVKLGRNPGGGIQARTMSDSTGYYNFDSIPDGNYTIYVDVPNLPMDSTRSVTIAASTGDTVFVQNNYYADSLTIYVLDSTVAVGIYAYKTELANTFNVYPNPSSSILNVSFELANAIEANIMITDVLGQIVYETKTNKESNTLHLDHLQTGVYNISVINGNTKATQRLVLIRK